MNLNTKAHAGKFGGLRWNVDKGRKAEMRRNV
jgi:hypothetical protein